MKSLYLGIDVGTTWCKAALVDAEGREQPAARRRTPWRPVATGAEADPDELSDTAVAVALEAIEASPGGRVAGVGVTSMAEAGVLLDRRGAPVLPVIAWHDTRGRDAAARLDTDLPGFSRRTGLAPTSVLTIAKHGSLRPSRCVRWLNVAEWVVRKLGGDERAELSLASRTGYLDLRAGRSWRDALEWAGMPPGLLPEPAIAGTWMGRTRALGEPARDAALTVAGHDHLAAAFGARATGLGDLLDSCGTAEALVRAVPARLAPNAIESAVASGLSVAWHVVEGRWALVGGFQSGKLLAEPGGPARIPELARRARDFRVAIEAIAGPSRRLIVTGGWARDPDVARVKRQVLGEFESAPVIEAGCVGAALLARAAAESMATA
jgi:sugar (pentulose or hexulose) kinase